MTVMRPVATLAFSVLAAAGVAAQTGVMPRTPPTSESVAHPSIGLPAATGVAGPQKHRAKVTVTNGTLQISADNSSLNAILREVAARTGMTITGGVLDQRVFGTYGPGPSPEVLSQLLEDTGANMMLRMTPSGGLGELSLSPRMGGPTPPGPSTFRDEEDVPAPAMVQPASPAASSAPPPQQQPPQLPFSRPANQPAATDPMQTPVTPDPAGFVSAPTVAPATEPGTTPGPATQTTGSTDPNSGSGNGTPQSPNGVKTPQQIYEQLQKLMQQQPKPPATQ